MILAVYISEKLSIFLYQFCINVNSESPKIKVLFYCFKRIGQCCDSLTFIHLHLPYAFPQLFTA